MKRLFAKVAALGCLLSLLVFGAPSAFAQNVATCSTATDGTVTTGNAVTPCTGTLSYIGPSVPATAIIADMRCGGSPVTCPTSWMLASKVSLTGDQVWGLKSSTLTAGNEHWYVPSGLLTIGTAPNPPPSPTPTTGTGTFTLTWIAPTLNTDGSIVSIASYNIFQGASATTLAKVANVLAPVTSYLTPALPPGTYWFAVNAVSTAGVTSAMSLTASGTIPAACGAAPANATQTVACPTGTTGSWIQTHGWVAAAYPTCWTATAWTPTAAPAGACVTTTTKPTKVTITLPVPTVTGSVTCTATAQ
jgi:hypothetical protein